MIDYLRTCCEFTSVHLLGLFLCIAFVVHTYAQRLPKKKFDKKKPTTVLITGGAQGLGKLLAQQFASSCPTGSVKLIIWDIRDDLEESCIADVKKAAGSHRFSSVFFYKANLANT
jgi:UDP-N-acetylglucosamine:LPS N-acetylglucosamine transferase